MPAVDLTDLKERLEEIDKDYELKVRQVDYLKNMLVTLQKEKVAVSALIEVYEPKVIKQEAPKNVLTTEQKQEFRNQPVTDTREKELDLKIKSICTE